MNERLREIRLTINMSQEEFGKKIGIESRAHISSLENGNRNITDRIVNDVCREFNVNETWLRTGEGEMFIQRSEEEEIAGIVYELLDPKDDDFYKAVLALVQAYGDLSDSSQQVVREMIRGTMKYFKKRKGD